MSFWFAWKSMIRCIWLQQIEIIQNINSRNATYSLIFFSHRCSSHNLHKKYIDGQIFKFLHLKMVVHFFSNIFLWWLTRDIITHNTISNSIMSWNDEAIELKDTVFYQYLAVLFIGWIIQQKALFCTFIWIFRQFKRFYLHFFTIKSLKNLPIIILKRLAVKGLKKLKKILQVFYVLL